MKTFSMPSPQEMHHLIEFCKVMASSPFYLKLGPGGVMAIYLTAKEYDLPFMACLNGGLHTFDGKVTFSAIMIDALIIKAGHKTDLIHLDERSCKIRFSRGDRRNDPDYKPLEYEYTIDQAHKAGYLSKNNWKTSPKDMLYSRCLTGGGRKHTPEVFVGVLVSGELVGDDSDSNITPLLPPKVAQIIDITPNFAEIQQKEEQKQIEDLRMPGFDEFVLKHNILADVEGKSTPAYEYVTEICKKINKSHVYVINSAIKNEETFKDKFGKWMEAKSK